MKARGDLLLLAPVVKNRKGFHTDVAPGPPNTVTPRCAPMEKCIRPIKRAAGSLSRARRGNRGGPAGQKAAPTAGAKAAREMIDETLDLGRGTALRAGQRPQNVVHSTERSCPQCGESFGPLDPKMFSYNSSRGWCPRLPRVWRDCFICRTWSAERGPRRSKNRGLTGRRASANFARPARARGSIPSPAPCAWAGRAAAKAVPTIVDISNASVEAALAWFGGLRLKGREAEIARDILPEIRERLEISARRSAWAICNWAAARPRFRAAKRNASAWPRSSGPISAASCIFWTSRPSACTRATMRNCSRPGVAQGARQFPAGGRARRGNHAAGRLHH
jgi:excinuclease ABC subunit A